MSTEPILISITEISDYLRCRRAWNYGSPMGMGLTQKGSPATALHIGTGVHYGIEQQIAGKDPLEAVAQWCEDHIAKTLLEYQERVGTRMSTMEVNKLEESHALIRGMVKHYFERYGDNPIGPLKYLAAEFTFQIPTGIHTKEGREIILVGTIDGVAEDDNSRIVVVERKTYSIKTDLKTLQFDHQQLGYVACLQHLIKEPVNGCLYDGLNKKLPKLPKQLKNGRPSMEWNDNITSASFVESWFAYMGSDTPLDAEAEAFRKRLAIRDGLEQTPFFTRHKSHYGQHQIAGWWENTLAILQEIADDPAITFNRAWSGCWDCWFQPLCDAESRGTGFEEAMRAYEPSGYRPQYRELQKATPATVASVSDLKKLCGVPL
jgi:hypothetical protein